nr:hypothetical protein [Tanacetum cinerariifolium]
GVALDVVFHHRQITANGALQLVQFAFHRRDALHRTGQLWVGPGERVDQIHVAKEGLQFCQFALQLRRGQRAQRIAELAIDAARADE